MKNHLLTTKKLGWASVCLLNSLFILSCTKTEIQPYEKQHLARISSFKIVNTTTEIIGAINNDDKTITVTLPAGLYMSSLEPEIKVASGAELKPGTDTLITNLLDYFTNGRNIQYPVTATDGSTATYTLTIKSDQPILDVQEVTTDPNSPVSYDQTYGFTSNFITINTVQPNYPFMGIYETDLTIARASLVDKNGKEYPFERAISQVPPGIENAYISLLLNDIEGRVTGTGSSTKYNQVPEAGDYYIKLRYYSREVTLKNPIRIFYNN